MNPPKSQCWKPGQVPCKYCGIALHDYGSDQVRACGTCHMLEDLIQGNPDAARRIIEAMGAASTTTDARRTFG